MARRHNHYEAAFEDYVRSRGWPYVPVDEKKKAIFGGCRVKSFDFLVYPRPGDAWLVDIKGRQFPYTGRNGNRFWENWVTRQDLEGLARWNTVFGDGFTALLVFAYWLVGAPQREPTGQVHVFRGQSYAFVAIPASQYAQKARTRSPKWDTISVPTRAFRSMITPIVDPPENDFPVGSTLSEALV